MLLSEEPYSTNNPCNLRIGGACSNGNLFPHLHSSFLQNFTSLNLRYPSQHSLKIICIFNGKLPTTFFVFTCSSHKKQYHLDLVIVTWCMSDIYYLDIQSRQHRYARHLFQMEKLLVGGVKRLIYTVNMQNLKKKQSAWVVILGDSTKIHFIAESIDHILIWHVLNKAGFMLTVDCKVRFFNTFIQNKSFTSDCWIPLQNKKSIITWDHIWLPTFANWNGSCTLQKLAFM